MLACPERQAHESFLLARPSPHCQKIEARSRRALIGISQLDVNRRFRISNRRVPEHHRIDIG